MDFIVKFVYGGGRYWDPAVDPELYAQRMNYKDKIRYIKGARI